MNRKQLLKLAADGGFKGDVSLETLTAFFKTYLAENDLVVNGETFTIDDVATAYATKAAVNLDIETPATPEPVTKAATARGTNSPNAATVEGKTFGTFAIGSLDHKHYNAKAASGKNATHFTDADTAEVFGANMRLIVAQKNGIAEYSQKRNDLDICKKTGTTFTNSTGGALVPVQFYNQLIYRTEVYGVARKLCNVVPMASDTGVFPGKSAIVSMSPISETTSGITATDNTYKNVELTARLWGVLSYVSNSLLEDSAVNIADDYARSIAEAQLIAEDNALFLGDGTSTYANINGLIGALPSGSYIAQGSSNTWKEMTTGDFNKIMGSVSNVNPKNLAFACSRQFFHQVMMRLEKATSQFASLADLNADGAGGMFIGFPVYFTQVLPTATNTAHKPVYFGDFQGACMLGDRRTLRIESSAHAAFSQDLLAIRGTSRFDVKVHNDLARTTTSSMIACLKTG